MRTFQILVLTAVLAGCASGSTHVTGQVRPAIEDHTTVTILAEMPEGAEQIATVKVSSERGFSQPQKVDAAVEKLQRQAAKVGANAVVIDSTSSERVILSTGDLKYVIVRKGVIHGLAVWVD